MIPGVVPAILIVYLLYDEQTQPGVFWFLFTMVLGGVWALLFVAFTLAPSAGLTLALANVFWAVIPATSVTMFLFAAEYVSGKPVSIRAVVVLFVPVVVLFGLSWTNPAKLVHTSDYYVDSAGILHFPQFGGPLKVLVVKVYGYLLVTFATGIFLGEMIRTSGRRRREVQYTLFVFSILAASTLVKVANLVPIYFDPTSVVFSLSGVAFAVSVQRSGYLKLATIAREQAFEQVEDAILIVGPSGVILDANRKATELFERTLLFQPLDSVLEPHQMDAVDGTRETVSFSRGGLVEYHAVKESPVTYFRGDRGKVVVLTDVTAAKNREQDLELFKQITTRIFRHNFRNDLNVIYGFADLIASRTDGELNRYADEIRSTSERLARKAAKTEHIGDIFAEQQLRSVSVRNVVDRAVASFDAVPSSIERDVADVAVTAHPLLSLAVRELLENAFDHPSGDDPQVVRLYTDVSGKMVTLFVEDEGEGIPEFELQVLDDETETDLFHGSGIGLWLVYWIVKRSNGELVSESTATGSRVGIRLHIVSDDEPGR